MLDKEKPDSNKQSLSDVANGGDMTTKNKDSEETKASSNP